MRERLVFITGITIIVLVLAAALEGGAYLYTTYLAKRYGILFYLPHITEDFATYAARVNPRLGWPSPQALQTELTAAARTISHPDSDPQNGHRELAMSAYGDSFTAGYGVEPEFAWSNVLARMLGCRIANYGVPGYGTDQAYLRFLDNPRDQAAIVFLGVLSENIQRNVNQLRNFLIPNSQCQTKPRFVLDSQGQLQYVPLPPLTSENYDHFIRNPELFLKHDYFSPGGPSGAQKLAFPYTWSILKAHKFFYDRYILGYKSYLQFYAPGHPSQAFSLTVAIISRFLQKAKDRGMHPIVIVFPTDEDFRVYKTERRFVYEPLVRELNRTQVDYVDLGSELLKRLGTRDYMEIFSGEHYYHFNTEGNRLTAQILLQTLQNKGVLPVQVSGR